MNRPSGVVDLVHLVDSEVWIGTAAEGPAGSDDFTVDVVTVDFDRLEQGRICRVVIPDDRSAEGQALVDLLFPEVDLSEQHEHVALPVDGRAARVVGRLAVLLHDHDRAGEDEVPLVLLEIFCTLHHLRDVSPPLADLLEVHISETLTLDLELIEKALVAQTERALDPSHAWVLWRLSAEMTDMLEPQEQDRPAIARIVKVANGAVTYHLPDQRPPERKPYEISFPASTLKPDDLSPEDVDQLDESMTVRLPPSAADAIRVHDIYVGGKLVARVPVAPSTPSGRTFVEVPVSVRTREIVIGDTRWAKVVQAGEDGDHALRHEVRSVVAEHLGVNDPRAGEDLWELWWRCVERWATTGHRTSTALAFERAAAHAPPGVAWSELLRDLGVDFDPEAGRPIVEPLPTWRLWRALPHYDTIPKGDLADHDPGPNPEWAVDDVRGEQVAPGGYGLGRDEDDRYELDHYEDEHEGDAAQVTVSIIDTLLHSSETADR